MWFSNELMQSYWSTMYSLWDWSLCGLLHCPSSLVLPSLQAIGERNAIIIYIHTHDVEVKLLEVKNYMYIPTQRTAQWNVHFTLSLLQGDSLVNAVDNPE